MHDACTDLGFPSADMQPAKVLARQSVEYAARVCLCKTNLLVLIGRLIPVKRAASSLRFKHRREAPNNPLRSLSSRWGWYYLLY